MKNLFLSLKITLILLILFCFIYPISVFLVGQTLFSSKANGSLIIKDSSIIGSKLIAQPFKEAKYFHPRPSACNYKADQSSASNLAPTSEALHERIQTNAEIYRKENGLSSNFEIPDDAITESASGLDPHISLQNALLQLERVAKERNMSRDQIKTLVYKNSSNSIFGEPVVNVLLLNIDLEEGLNKSLSQRFGEILD